jgi:hypothetical protein
MYVLNNLGSCIPMVPFQTFLDYLAPPQPEFDLDATLQSLKLGPEPALTSSNRWSNFPKAQEDSQSSEDGLFSLLPDIFTKVVVAVAANSGGRLREENRTVDFLHNPSLAPTSIEARNESKPDGYLVLKDRNKRMSTDSRGEDILWADIALSCKYNWKNDDEDLYDVCIHQGI